MKTRKTRQANCLFLTAMLLSVVFTSFLTSKVCGADDEVVDMIVELLGGPDKDMRMLALQQIREEVPGEAATKRFVALIPKLPPAVQLELIDALGERGDPVARPAILKLLKSQNEPIRVKATQALSQLANPADVPVLAQVAATGSDAERAAARQSLRQLPGNAMNAAMIKALIDAEAKQKVELMGALVDRNVTESLPVMLKSAEHTDLAVRLAVLDVLRAMADETHTALLVKRVKLAPDKKERRQASLTLLALCKRKQIKCADAVIAGFAGADAGARILLLRALPVAGGPKALKVTVTRLKDEDKGVRDEAMRVLGGWPDRAATPHLKKQARDVKNMRNHVLALRGIVRLASPAKGRKPDLATLKEAMQLSTRKQEKVLVLGALGTIPTLESLTLAASYLDQPELAEDAGFAAVLIAEKISADKRAQARAVLQQVLKTVKSEKTRDRAKKVLAGPEKKEDRS